MLEAEGQGESAEDVGGEKGLGALVRSLTSSGSITWSPRCRQAESMRDSRS